MTEFSNQVPEDSLQIENIRELACHHIFHESCITSWFKEVRSCPICKARVSLLTANSSEGSTSLPQSVIAEKKISETKKRIQESGQVDIQDMVELFVNFHATHYPHLHFREMFEHFEGFFIEGKIPGQPAQECVAFIEKFFKEEGMPEMTSLLILQFIQEIRNDLKIYSNLLIQDFQNIVRGINEDRNVLQEHIDDVRGAIANLNRRSTRPSSPQISNFTRVESVAREILPYVICAGVAYALRHIVRHLNL